MKKLFILGMLALCSVIRTYPQSLDHLIEFESNCGFGHYLLIDRDFLRAKSEFERCTFEKMQLSYNVDTLNFFIALSYRYAGDFYNSNKYLDIMKRSDTKLYEYVSLMGALNALDANQNELSISELNKIDINTNGFSPLHDYSVKLLLINHAILGNIQKMNDLISNYNTADYSGIMDLSEDFYRVRNKSKYLAAFYSLAIPGLGKAYSNRPLDGLYSFVAVSFSAWRTYISYKNHGFDSPSFYFFGSLTLYFYLGNIYGSIVSAENYNTRRKAQFRKNLLQFVN